MIQQQTINSSLFSSFARTLLLIIFWTGVSTLVLYSQNNLQTPQIDSISVNSNGKPILSWTPNTDNTKGYAFQRQRPDGSYFPIDTIWGIDQSSYTDESIIINACNRMVSYFIFAVAPGEQPYVSPWSVELRTIFLSMPIQDICANTISLKWTSYINMLPELTGYDILASTDGLTYSIIGTNQPGDTTFTHIDPLPDELYSYKIRAFNPGKTRTSSSCVKTLQTRTYPKPDSLEILSVSVENNEFIKIEWVIDDPDVPLQSFTIEQRPEDQTVFTQIGSNTDLINYRPANSFDDLSADFSQQSYFYQIIIADSCGNYLPDYLSTSHRTVHLAGAPQSDYTNYLEWNHYEGWVAGVEKYKIYRRTADLFTELDEVNGSENSYSDPVSSLSSQGGVFTYYIEAFENGGNNATSKSNWITLEMETKILAPNAFIPSAQPPDNEFRPIVSFIAENSYELQIFNKWGQMIFRSVDPETGWDGTLNGEVQPVGAYVYLIKCRTPEGQNLEKRGTVTLIR